jgi:nitrite reductase/ring-hydroxylating ferredoxin subunit/cytochrome c553
MLKGCTIAEVFGGGMGELAFDVAEPKFAALATVNGVVPVDVAGRPLLLIRTTEDAIVALSRICTHTQCDMSPRISGRWDGSKLDCTCHGSQFAADGKVLKGPATRDLAVYPVSFDPATGLGKVVVGGGEPEEESPVPEEYRGKTNPFEDDDADALEAGQRLWVEKCQGCHGANGEGNDAFPEPKPTVFSGDTSSYADDYLFWRLRTGAATGPADSIMPAFDASALSDEEAWQVITYLRSLGQ